jgi:hypothetical protein
MNCHSDDYPHESSMYYRALDEVFAHSSEPCPRVLATFAVLTSGEHIRIPNSPDAYQGEPLKVFPGETSRDQTRLDSTGRDRAT